MMMRSTTLVLAGAVLCANFAFADGQKSAQLQAFDASQLQMATPKRMMKVRWENGQVIPLTDWIDLGDFAPAGPCDTTGATETLVFDHAAVDPDTGGVGARQICIPGFYFYFGPTYHNPFYANDIESLVNSSFNGATARSLTHIWFWNPNRSNPAGGSQRCIILIFATEEFDTECQVRHVPTALPGVALDYGTLNAGGWYSPVCLDPIGGIPLPATVADDGAPGRSVLGGYIVIYAQNLQGNQVTLASGAQPFLWHPELTDPRYGNSTSIQFDDDDPTNGQHDPLGGMLRLHL
jgi:hypothetical protein